MSINWFKGLQPSKKYYIVLKQKTFNNNIFIFYKVDKYMKYVKIVKLL